MKILLFSFSFLFFKKKKSSEGGFYKVFPFSISGLEIMDPTRIYTNSC
jgi:hypothetical protein